MEKSSQRIEVQQIIPSSGSRPIDQGHVYVRAQQGRWQRWRQRLGWTLMLLFLAGPWLRWNGRQAIWLDLEQQRFHLFGTTIWPQDLTLLALLLMVAAFALFFVTAFLGRVWCGTLCPQTVWTFWFIWVEERFEGSANQRRRLDQAPWTPAKIARKGGKHLSWLLIALLSGFTFIAYFVPATELATGLLGFSAGPWPSFWVLFFGLCTYLNAGWMRAIMCTHMCPYSRFQSAMFDQNTLTVAYDAKRGESRGPRARKADPKQLGLGDCIDCNLCVQVCPTGIDIRDGLQYECISCGACIDACDQTMNGMGYAPGLIRYASERELAGGETRLLRPRLLGYGLMMSLMLGLLAYAALSRTPLALDVLRDRNQLYREAAEGLVENSYTLKLANKTQQPRQYQLRVEGADGLHWLGEQEIAVPAGENLSLPVSLSADPYLLPGSMQTVTFVASDGEAEVRTESRFFSGGR
ncbi:cytochrome c oxidase accessory protein CcoG [Zobellella sp. DQSA1]|uniref:cytochrome c oxidase accessory protein CcoG n=1 Tax=Zobellella sp. DQSA1 TaxID=3342386 RepID=UPI0035C1AC48